MSGYDSLANDVHKFNMAANIATTNTTYYKLRLCDNHRLPRAKEADAPEHFEKNCSTSPNIGTTKHTSTEGN